VDAFKAHVNKTPTSCFRLNVFRLKKLNKRNLSDIGLVISKPAVHNRINIGIH